MLCYEYPPSRYDLNQDQKPYFYGRQLIRIDLPFSRVRGMKVGGIGFSIGWDLLWG